MRSSTPKAAAVIFGVILFATGFGLLVRNPAPAMIGPMFVGNATGGGTGPAGGCPPAPNAAVRAGFTTCIANYDWTGATQSSVNGANITLGAPANWLECAGATGAARQWAIVPRFTNPQPCANVAIVNDGGTTVLKLTYTVGNFSGMEMQTSNTGSSPPNPFTISFPTPIFIEFKTRNDAVDATNCPYTIAADAWNCLLSDTWNWYTGSGDIEYDFMEMYNNPVATAGTEDYGAGGAQIENSGASVTNDIYNYHVYGERVTTDGSSAIGVSRYLDGNFYKGTSFLPSQGVAAYSDRHYLILQDGEAGNTNSAHYGQACKVFYTNCRTYNGPIYTYWQWIHVYSCPNYSTGNCYGSVLTNAP